MIESSSHLSDVISLINRTDWYYQMCDDPKEYKRLANKAAQARQNIRQFLKESTDLNAIEHVRQIIASRNEEMKGYGYVV